MAVQVSSGAPILNQFARNRVKKTNQVLTQNSSVVLDTTKLPKNGSIVLDIPGCTTMEFFEAYTSPKAQAVWKANRNPNPLFAQSPPYQPKTVGLLVIKDANGRVESMLTYPKKTKFTLANNPYPAGSIYKLTATEQGMRNPITYMNLKSPVTKVQIPAALNGGFTSNADAVAAPKHTI